MRKTPSGPTAEKWVGYEARASYSSLFTYGPQTQRMWMVFHGIGYLARYFLRHFEGLDANTNYVVAPQAPSLYYLNDTYTHVGASWLTREQTQPHMENLLGFLDGVARAEDFASAPERILLGYSQGVSVLLRWAARRKVACEHLVLYAGKPPAELTPEDFSYLPETTRVLLLFGAADPFLPETAREGLLARYRELFGKRLELHMYAGGHKWQTGLIETLV